jgi:ribulose-5-phosphate 4-epimerase/fuculose-1-phosphate aldolase
MFKFSALHLGLVMTAALGGAQSPIVDPALIEDLVAANRILYDQSVVDGFGHVSVRHDKNPEHFLLARSMAPGLVTAPDIMEFDRDGNAIDPKGRAVYLERFIHSEIYKARPEVKAVVHSHSPAVIPFGVTSVTLRPVFHLSSFLAGGAPVFEIRDVGGYATDMLIRTPELDAALARTLGAAPVALMRAASPHSTEGLGGAPSAPAAVPSRSPPRQDRGDRIERRRVRPRCPYQMLPESS